MVGNVNMERVVGQQGDLVFVDIVPNLSKAEWQMVEEYDSHRFTVLVRYTDFSSKDRSNNILGYVELAEATELTHPEHKRILLPPAFIRCASAAVGKQA